MGRINSNRKGKRGELLLCEELRELGFQARRSQQYCGADQTADVVTSIEGVHIESKFVENLSVYKAMGQAVADCGDSVPVVAHKRSRQEWILILRMKDLKRFAQRIAEATKQATKSETTSEPSKNT